MGGEEGESNCVGRQGFGLGPGPVRQAHHEWLGARVGARGEGVFTGSAAVGGRVAAPIFRLDSCQVVCADGEYGNVVE